jgi:protein XagA
MEKLLITTFLFLLIGNSFAQGWSQKRGEGYFKLGHNGIRASSYFTPDGSNIPITTTGVYSIGLYGEYGISSRLTGITNVPFWVSNTLNEVQFRQSGRVIPGDSFTSLGDIDLGVKYGWFQDRPIVLATSLIFGIPTGKTGGGETGILQTGDSEFNQLLRTDASFSLPNSIYFSGFVAFNNRTRDFSDEVRYGLDLGYFKKKLLLAFHLSVIQSLQNGNAENVSNGIFANNLEFVLPSLEIGWFFQNNFGISAYANQVISGQNVLNGPGYGVGIFYQLKKTSKLNKP